MTKLKQKRNRGVVLTPQGLEKLQAARSQLEYQKNFGERYTYEKISELTNLDLNTIKKVLVGKEGVDKRSLERCFLAFDLQLTEEHYMKPHAKNRHDWGEAVAIEHFLGRRCELDTLENWLLRDRCRLVAILGMGGIGKTTLSIKLAQKIEGKFDCVIWKSLRDAPPVAEILAYLIEFISEGKETEANLSPRIGERITKLIDYLRNLRCLIILDNAESLLDSGSRVGKYRPGYEDYGELLRRVGSTHHISCLMLTTREKPKEVAILEGDKQAVRALQLEGLREKEGQKIFYFKGVVGSDVEFKKLSDRYAGNPLALKVVATTIQDLFAGNIGEFLHQDMAVFGDIRDVLDQQFARLSALEQEIMYWLAIAREPISLQQLQEDFVWSISPIKLLEALESLSRRSLIEKNAACFTQQPVVMEYVTSHLIEKVCAEIVAQQPQLFRDHALIKATAKDYIRENQIRLILQPVIHELLAVFRSKKELEDCLRQILVTMQERSPLEKWYVAGNILNLFCHLETDLTGYDFSNLCVWQADLRQTRLHQVNFQNADLSRSVFAEDFGGIWSLAFSPDGQYLAVGDTKGNILLRRVADGQPINSFSGHNSWVVTLAFSPDSAVLASGSCDCTVKLWDVDTGQCLHSLEEHKHEVWSVAFSPDGQILATGCDDHQARLWDINTGQCYKIFSGHSNLVTSVTFSLDGKQLFTAGHDNLIRQWDIETGECNGIFQGHDDGIRALDVSPNGQLLASSSNDRTIRLWDLKTGECQSILSGHTNGVWSIIFHPQGNFLASSGVDRTVRLWNISKGECLKVFPGHSNIVNAIAFSAKGDLLASGSHDQTFKLWNLSNYQCWKTFQGNNNQALSVTYSRDGQMLASGGQDCKVRLWDLTTGRVIQTMEEHSNWVWSVAFSPQGKLLASGSGDKTIKLWDLHSDRVIKTLRGHQAVVRAIAFNKDGGILASGSEDATLKLWDLQTGQIIHSFEEHQADIWSVAFSQDGQMVASGSLDGTIKLWDLQTGNCHQTLEQHTDWVFAVIFSPDNQTIASTSSDGTIRLWKIETGECHRVLREDKGYSPLVDFSMDGQTIASCNQDHQIKLWNVKTGKCLRTLSGHQALINSIAFCPEDQTLVSGSEDETIKLWDLKNGNCTKILKVEKPYESMNIMGIKGLTKANLETLKVLGALEKSSGLSKE